MTFWSLPGLILAHLLFLLVVHALLYYLHPIVCTLIRFSVYNILKAYRQEHFDLCDRKLLKVFGTLVHFNVQDKLRKVSETFCVVSR